MRRLQGAPEVNDIKIRYLKEKDWETWKAFRLEALQNNPESFSSSYEDEVTWPDSMFQDSLTKNHIFGVFVHDVLVAGGGFYALTASKTKHRGVVWGVYTQPAYRGKGYARLLLKEIIADAKKHVSQLHLSCITTNAPAITLYKQLGFRIYAQEPKSLKVGDQFFDDYLMVLDITT
jgi:ribosomal protein S18 acetylase RimI-like enzyme